jgi:hypothetical protein
MAPDKPKSLADNGAGEGGADKGAAINKEPPNYQCKYWRFNECPNRVLTPNTPCEECKGKGFFT